MKPLLPILFFIYGLCLGMEIKSRELWPKIEAMSEWIAEAKK